MYIKIQDSEVNEIYVILKKKAKILLINPESVQGHLGECINTEFVWEYLTQGFVKVAVRRAVCLLCCSKTRGLWSSKGPFTIFFNAFFAAINHNNCDHKQRILKDKNTQNRSKSTSHKPWQSKVLGSVVWKMDSENAIEYWILIRWIVIYQVDSAIQPLNNRHLFPKMSAKMIDGSKSANVSWLLNLRTRLFLKSTVNECPLRELPLYNIFVHSTVTCMKPNIFDLSY